MKGFRKVKWRNVSIGRKYILAFIVSILMFAASGFVVFTQVEKVKDNLEALEYHGDQAIHMTDMGSLIKGKDVRVANYIIFGNNQTINEYQERRVAFNELQAKISENIDTKDKEKLFTRIVENNKEMDQIFLDEIVAAVDKGQDTLFITLRNKTHQLRSKTVKTLEELRTITNDEREQAIQIAESSLKKSVLTLLIAIALTIFIGITLISIINRMIQSNLHKVVDMANDIAQGNLQVNAIEYQGNDEIGQLAKAINEMKDSLSNVIQNVASVSATVSTQSEALTRSSREVKEGSEQIASTMQELSSGAESQANSSSNLSEMMEQFAQRIQQAHKKGEGVADTSSHVLTMTNEGTQLMDQSVEKMRTIDHIVKDAVHKVQGLDNQSKKISKLVQVIKDIAEQTNLLSLNAAIEAARAGEHGKGFAVVADEVRKLAEQVSVSVGDITGIVDTIQSESKRVSESLELGYKEVDEGTKQIEVTGKTFDQIHHSVSDMVNGIQNISQSLQDIANNSNDMTRSIEEIASVSEESAAGIEQASASSLQSTNAMDEILNSTDELAELGEQLNQQVRTFRI